MALAHVRPAQAFDLGLARRVGRGRRIEALPALAGVDRAALGGIDRLVAIHDALDSGAPCRRPRARSPWCRRGAPPRSRRAASCSGTPALTSAPTTPPVAAPATAPTAVAASAPAATTGPRPGMAMMPRPASRPAVPPSAAPTPAAGAGRRLLLDAGALVADILVGDQVDVRARDARRLEVGHDLAGLAVGVIDACDGLHDGCSFD